MATAFAAALTAAPAWAAPPPPPPPAVPTASYATLADLADSAPMILHARVRTLTRVEPERARGVRTGWGRFYMEARTQALIVGNEAIGGMVSYLIDLPLDARGRPPRVQKQFVLLFARSVPGRPGEIQLVTPEAQVLWNEPTETNLRGIVAELLAPGAPGRISGVREAIHVPGTLAGEGETQIFLDTPDGAAASITVFHRPRGGTAWGASFSEVLGNPSGPPPRDTLAWYRLACFLPPNLPRGANLSETPRDRAQAEADYRMVIGELGVCRRTRQ